MALPGRVGWRNASTCTFNSHDNLIGDHWIAEGITNVNLHSIESRGITRKALVLKIINLEVMISGETFTRRSGTSQVESQNLYHAEMNTTAGRVEFIERASLGESG